MSNKNTRKTGLLIRVWELTGGSKKVLTSRWELLASQKTVEEEVTPCL